MAAATAAQRTPMGDPVPQTPFAKKYGVAPIDPDNLFRPYGKSGFTPTEPLITILSRTAGEIEAIEAINTYQSKWFSGFSSRMLEDMGAFPDPDARIAPLTNPIHPLFSRWESTVERINNRPSIPLTVEGECYTLPPSNTGFFTFDNPVVYDVLDPVLRLASRFIANMHTSQWIDAFLCGEYKPLPPHLDPRPPSRKTPTQLQTFHRRPQCAIDPSQTRKEVEQWLPILQRKIWWTISDGRYHETDRVTLQPGGAWLARTVGSEVGEKAGDETAMAAVLATVSTQVLTPLLRNDLSASERLAEQVFCALVIVHELVHAINLALIGIPSFKGKLSINEPFFESEPVAELGWSFTSTLLGGAINNFFSRSRDNAVPVPHLGFLLTDWPNVKYFQGDGTVIGGIGNLRPEPAWRPILSTWYESLQRDGFWDYAVGRLGVELVRAWGVGGSRVHYAVSGVLGKVGKYEMVHGMAEGEWEAKLQDLRKRALMGNVAQMSPEQRRAYKYAEQVERKHQQAAAQREFRGRREVLAGEIEIALQNLHAATSGGRLGDVKVALSVLFGKLEQEGMEQRDELLTLIRRSGLHNSDFARHKELLIKLNRHLRKLLAGFTTDCLEFLETSLELDSRPVSALARACQVVLHDDEKSFTDAVGYLRDVAGGDVNVLMGGMERLGVGFDGGGESGGGESLYTASDEQTSASGIQTLLTALRAAHEENNEALCDERAFDLLLSLDGAVAGVQVAEESFARLVVRVCALRRRGEGDRLGEAESIAVALGDVSGVGEEERGYWVNVVRGVVEGERKRRKRGVGLVGRRKIARVRGHVDRARRDDEMDLG